MRLDIYRIYPRKKITFAEALKAVLQLPYAERVRIAQELKEAHDQKLREEQK
jgi:hypothetical protein